jgi:hypothetical protein
MKNQIEIWAPWMDAQESYHLIGNVQRKPDYLRKITAAMKWGRRRSARRHPQTVHVLVNPRQQRLRLVYGLLSLRVPDDVQKPFRFCGAKFLRNHSRSGHNHVLGRLYYCKRAFV